MRGQAAKWLARIREHVQRCGNGLYGIMMSVKILGAGCPNCKRLEQEVRAALDSAQPPIAYEIVKVTDFAEIMTYGILSTPGLVINDIVFSTGRIPKRQQIIDWATQYQNAA